MEFEIKAGAKLNLLTQPELRGELADFAANWRSETTKGDRYRRIYGYGTPSGGRVTFGGDNTGGEMLGPAQGFVWDVRRLALYGHTVGTDNSVGLYVNAAESSNLVTPSLLAYQGYTRAELVLYPGDRLLVDGAVTPTGRIALSGAVRELPIGLAWRL